MATGKVHVDLGAQVNHGITLLRLQPSSLAYDTPCFHENRRPPRVINGGDALISDPPFSLLDFFQDSELDGAPARDYEKAFTR